jgi:hypothetical protein
MMNDSRVERFATTDLAGLRNSLMQSGLDFWQAAEVLVTFLAGHGYGVNHDQARAAVMRIEGSGCNYECMQSELERVALVM